MSNLTYLFVAFLITWVVIAGYLWMLGRQVQNLKDEVDYLTEGNLVKSEPAETAARADVESHQISSRLS